jgi:hypothetical protein
MKAKKSKAQKLKQGNVQKIPRASRKAWDDGGKLLPVERKKTDEGHYERILELADVLLNPKGKY